MAELLDGCKVRDLTLGDREHTVRLTRDGTGTEADHSVPAPAKNSRLIPAARTKIAQAERALAQGEAARDAKLIDPQVKVALLHTRPPRPADGLRLPAHNADHWLSYEVMR